MPGEEARTVIRRASGTQYGENVIQAFAEEGLKLAEQAGERNALRRAMLRPVADLIEKDPDAKAALDRLRKIDRKVPSASAQRLADWTGGFPDLSNTSPGLNFFSPPYDYQRVAGRIGFQSGASTANELAGTTDIDGFGGEADGFLFASAGLGFDLMPSKDGRIDFRPYVQVDYSGSAHGYNLSSHIEGHLVTSALDDAGNTVVTPTDYTLFNFDDENSVNDGGTLSAPWVSINFPVRANRTYQVWIDAIVRGDQSGVYAFANSEAGGQIHVRTPFVVAELR